MPMTADGGRAHEGRHAAPEDVGAAGDAGAAGEELTVVPRGTEIVDGRSVRVAVVDAELFQVERHGVDTGRRGRAMGEGVVVWT
jgi:hypothetical protein